MLDKGTCLRFYKRPDIQQALVEHARNKEVGMRYNESYGKRPDILGYPRDVVELAKRGVTSFHASEEIWINPLEISSQLKKKDLDTLRSGWDLVLDIDCPDWEISKLTAYLFVQALARNGVQNITCKFSGNKGFHIGVPFQAFPKQVEGKPTQLLFPDAPKKIAQYLLHQISNNIFISNNKIVFDGKYAFTLLDLKKKFGEKDFLRHLCSKCEKKIILEVEKIQQFICTKCDAVIEEETDFKTCEKCHILMQKMHGKKTLCSCGSNEYNSTFNPLSILEIDTVLISSRHLYRMPYSFHEKSGLVSLPIDPEKIMSFEKSMAHPDKVLTPMFTFLDRNVTESARSLLLQALDFEVKIEEEREEEKKYQNVDITSPIGEEFFPPCMTKMLQGLEDGKKRAIFCIMNYLGKIGWTKPEIEEFLIIWNKEKNPDPLREVYLKGQLSSFIPGSKLPPNCDNDAYYKALGVACNKTWCKKLKNPVNFTLSRWRRYLRDKDAGLFDDDKTKKHSSPTVADEAHESNINEAFDEPEPSPPTPQTAPKPL
jgi:ribosomal protein L37AE/L43A